MLLTVGTVPYQLALLFAAHFIGDFAFQSKWMVDEKVRDNEVLTYHVATYTAPFAVLAALPGTHITVQGLVAHFLIHWAVDWLKGHGYIKHIWQDQLLHLTTILALFAIGWF